MSREGWRVRRETGFDRDPAGAVISKNGLYRYWWHRQWHRTSPVAVFGMLNPSTADGERNDPTSRRVTGFARLWDLGAAVIVNLFAGRSTEPDGLLEWDDPVGPRNQEFVAEACRIVKARPGSVFVVAWGAHRIARSGIDAFEDVLRKFDVKPMALKFTAGANPQHPLYAPIVDRTELEEWKL